MTQELAVNLLIAFAWACGIAAIYFHWQRHVWKAAAEKAMRERDALLAAQAQRRADLAEWGRKGRQIQLEKRGAA